MSDVIICAENIGKCYTLNHQAGGGGYRKFSDTLIDAAKVPLQWLKAGGRAQPQATSRKEEFWALKDVSFEIKRGEVVGIIGRNGAGKSTLLKILSRITEPTKGRITLDGRVASLLEVGTGFHPELTGRENIYLNGAILGMTRAEIAGKFDEIVAFAEIERFLDTPVKRYSSGMYVRLAFAVAAHLEPEILIVDEVLAVGDAQFQAKCLGKMQDVASGGRTVLFVSHNLAAVRTLCSVGVLLEKGRVIEFGRCENVLATYISRQAVEQIRSGQLLNRRLSDRAEVHSLQCDPPVVVIGSDVTLRLFIRATDDDTMLESALLLYNSIGVRVAIVDLRTAAGPLLLKAATMTEFKVQVHGIPLIEGDYEVGLYYRSERASGDYLNLGHLIVSPGRTESGIVPFAPVHRGVVDLTSSLTIKAWNGDTSQLPPVSAA